MTAGMMLFNRSFFGVTVASRFLSASLIASIAIGYSAINRYGGMIRTKASPVKRRPSDRRMSDVFEDRVDEVLLAVVGEELMDADDVVRGDGRLVLAELAHVVVRQVGDEPDRGHAGVGDQHEREDGVPALLAPDVQEVSVLFLSQDPGFHRIVIRFAHGAKRDHPEAVLIIARRRL